MKENPYEPPKECDTTPPVRIATKNSTSKWALPIVLSFYLIIAVINYRLLRPLIVIIHDFEQ